MRLQGQATHTLAVMAVSKAAFEEIKGKLEEAGYDHAIHHEQTKRVGMGETMLDMSGIGILMEDQGSDDRKTEAISLRLNAEEKNMLIDLTADGTSQSQVIRNALHVAVAALGKQRLSVQALKYDKTWNDQPDVVTRFPVVFSFYVERGVEVRAGEQVDTVNEPHINRAYYVTTGNLFGSQTLRVYGEDRLFEVLRLAVSKAKAQTTPTGVELLENCK